MNEVKVIRKQNFMGKKIPVVLGGFGENKKCMSDKTIAEIHGMETKNIRARVTSNIKRFKENVDIIDLKQGAHEVSTLGLLLDLGYTKSTITQAEHIYILSERGYSKLIKIMNTDLAWEIHDKLIDEYFSMRREINSISPKDIAALSILNAKTDLERTIALKEYDELISKPLKETIRKQEPMVELAELRISQLECYSITDATKTLGLRRGQITGWAKKHGFIHKVLNEVNVSGMRWFKVYSTDGRHNQIGVTNEGLLYLKENLEEIK